jgi:hypothetical protein
LTPSPLTKAALSCSAKTASHLLGDPLLDVDDGVVEQGLRRRRHGVELHRREGHVGDLLRRALRARVGFGRPAGGGAAGRKGLAQAGAGDRAHRGDGADRRGQRQAAKDVLLGRLRHEITAVGAGADRQGLGFDLLQRRRLAATHVAQECLLVLTRRAIVAFRPARGQARTGAIESDAVEATLCLVERVFDARDFLLGENIGAEARFDLRETFVVGVPEGGEGAMEFLEGGGDLGGRRFGFEARNGVFDMHDCSLLEVGGGMRNAGCEIVVGRSDALDRRHARLRQHRKGDEGDFPEIDLEEAAHAALAVGHGTLRAEADRQTVDGAFTHQRVNLAGAGDVEIETAGDLEAARVLDNAVPDADGLARVVAPQKLDARRPTEAQRFTEGAGHDFIAAHVDHAEEAGVALEGARSGRARHGKGGALDFQRRRGE